MCGAAVLAELMLGIPTDALPVVLMVIIALVVSIAIEQLHAIFSRHLHSVVLNCSRRTVLRAVQS